MANLFLRTYIFVDGTTAYGSQVEAEIANIVNTLNNLNTAATNWGQVSTFNAVSVPLIADCGAGSQDIADFKNNNVIKVSISAAGLISANGAAMNSNKVTGVASGTTSGDAIQYGQWIGGQTPGTTTNDSASSGNIGEYIESLKTSATTGSTTLGTYTDTGVSITLTAGDWDVYFDAELEVGGATATGVNGAVSHLTLTDNSNTIIKETYGGFANTTMPLNETWLSASKRISIASTTTYKTRFTATNNGGGSLTITSLTINAGVTIPITLRARRAR